MFEITNQEVDRILAAWYDVDMDLCQLTKLTNHQESTAGFFGSGVSRIVHSVVKNRGAGLYQSRAS